MKTQPNDKENRIWKQLNGLHVQLEAATITDVTRILLHMKHWNKDRDDTFNMLKYKFQSCSTLIKK